MSAGLQLTYLPDHACWFFWRPDGSPVRSPLPGAAATATLAVPDGDRTAAREVDGVEVAVDTGWEWLAGRAPSPGDSGALAAWTRGVRAPGPLPPAAHCAVTADGGHIRSALATLRLLDRDRRVLEELAGFDGRLRGYQLAGVRWLRARPGAILADDMGLGKTVQALALMLLYPDRPHLVVCPTSVTANWEREAARYAPDLAVTDGPPGPGTLTVVSYTRLRLDSDRYDRDWGVAVLDEAQQIKNPRTLAHRAARRLRADHRVAMTGTPVENGLSDLWALAEVVAPGRLGTRRAFHDRFVAPISRRGSAAAAARLAARTRDLVLRRTKAEVAAELPAREHVDLPCPLTEEQQCMYGHALDEAFGRGFGSGATRRGNVLALLTRLGQICNHPVQAGSQGPLAGRSGKLDRLTDMLGEAVAAGTGCLVFTRYTAMGRLIVSHLADALGIGAPFLHGGLTSGARDRIVRDYQEGKGSGVLVLSLRAAGFGITLTRATTVVHYDRWWNPAVEDQASDRVHRIGQDRPVTVYALRAAGTLEDRIAAVHGHKRGLAGALTRGGEAELLTLPDAELYEVLRPGGRR
ncbi:DEAD/DEAH box helicase [Nocardiopsis sp. CC223A]|uniref:DEAD/DEAH box helicase n=1 Tax=Nocardiopsis sp. CC223A TaxID=3044051 RepID=UPI00278BCCB6|nr:DEAD/DEAH box helicase [Nocardiopsis sp. CC223A]